MSVTSITADGYQYTIDVTEQGGDRIVTESAVKAAAAGIANDDQLRNIYAELFKSGIKLKLESGTMASNLADLEKSRLSIENLSNNGLDGFVFDIAGILKIFAQCNQTMRDSARETRNAEMTSQVTALKSSADELRIAAQKQFQAGLAQNIASGIGGVVQIGASSLSLRASLKAADSNYQAAAWKAESKFQKIEGHLENSIDFGKKASNFATDASKYSGNAGAFSERGAGFAGIVNAGGGATATILNNEGKMHEIDSTDLQTEAKIHETAIQHANELMQNTLEIIRDIRSQIGAMQQAQNETNRGIARNI